MPPPAAAACQPLQPPSQPPPREQQRPLRAQQRPRLPGPAVKRQEHDATRTQTRPVRLGSSESGSCTVRRGACAASTQRDAGWHSVAHRTRIRARHPSGRPKSHGLSGTLDVCPRTCVSPLHEAALRQQARQRRHAAAGDQAGNVFRRWLPGDAHAPEGAQGGEVAVAQGSLVHRAAVCLHGRTGQTRAPPCASRLHLYMYKHMY